MFIFSFIDYGLAPSRTNCTEKSEHLYSNMFILFSQKQSRKTDITTVDKLLEAFKNVQMVDNKEKNHTEMHKWFHGSSSMIIDLLLWRLGFHFSRMPRVC